MRVCLDCHRLTAGTRCDEHERARVRARNARRGPHYAAEYRRERTRVLADATVCAICHRPPTPGDPLTADHIIPVAHGGGAVGNLRPAHRSCNSARGARLAGGRP